MTFRVTNYQNDLQFLLENRTARERESQVLERLSTLKKVNRASDDPDNYGRIRDAKDALAETIALRENLESTLQRFTAVEDALGGIRDSLAEARELVIGGVSITNTDSERETIADQLAEIRGAILNRLNTRYEGDYLFSGTATTTQPFQDPVTGNYSGNGNLVTVRLSPSDRMVTNWPGEDIAFGPGGQGSADDVLDALADLETEFRANNLAGVNAEIPRLEPAFDRINRFIGEVGARSGRLLAEQAYYENFELSMNATLAELEDADLAEEAVNLDTVQNQIQAQLRTQSTIDRQSLLDFLG